MCRVKLARILFIAPSDTKLDVVPEIDALYEYGYSVQSVQGEVSRARLFDLVRRQKFDVLHFACHSGPDGVLLSKAEMFDTPSIVQFAKMCNATLVFLNSCQSIEVGQILIDEDIPAVICTRADVQDQIAKETAQAFYKQLTAHGDIRRAYHDSRPPIKGGYSLFTDGLLDSIQFGPIIERLEKFETVLLKSQQERVTIVAANDAEHTQFRETLATLIQCSKSILALKRWGILVFSVAVGVVTLINVFFLLIRSGP